MDDNQQQKAINSLQIITEQILSTALGNQIQIDKMERLTEKGRRNLLIRCFIDPIDGLASSYIIKKVETENYNPNDAEAWDTRRFFNDWIGSQFLRAIPSNFKHSPLFYGGDRNLGFIVIEDVQHRNSLVEPLLGSDKPKAEWALLEYATCLGQLHGDTLGKVEKFKQLYKKVSPNMKPSKVTVDIQKYQLMLEKLGIELKSNWFSDLKAINETVNSPKELMTYIHTDACPDNVLDTGTELRLIDFETGFFGHAFLDAAFGRMMFPSCWCSKRLPDAMVREMEHTYRTIMVRHLPVLEEDDVFETALVHTCGFWLLDTLSRYFDDALEKDEEFGISTIRQRILARLEVFISTSKEFDRLAGLRNTSSQLLDLLQKQWSDVPNLPFYPAFEDV